MAYEWIIEALDETWSATVKLLAPLSPERYDAPTPCPGWSVRDVVSHLVGFELMLQGEALPDVDTAGAAHVHNPIGELNEKFVAARRDAPGADVLAEFERVSAVSLSALRAKTPDEWDQVGWSPEGDVPYHRFQETRLLDSWIHLQDLRDALLMPDDDHGVGEEVVVNRFEGALPYVIGRRVAAPEGTSVRVNLVGRLARVISIDVTNGRARAVASLSDVPTVEITTPVALFWRRVAGRISAEAFLRASATDVVGDRALATRIADEMTILP